MREPVSFWRENVIPVTIRRDGNKSSNVRSFIILQSGEGLTSFTKSNPTNFCGEKKVKLNFQGCNFFFKNKRKEFFKKSNLVFVVVLVPESTVP